MIAPLERTFSVSYRDERLKNVFVFNSAEKDATGSYRDDYFQAGESSELLDELATCQVEDSLFIAADIIRDTDAIRYIGNLADNNVQVFLFLTECEENNLAIDALSGRCCIRTGSQQHGMILIGDYHSKSAWSRVCSSGFVEKGYQYSLALETDQIDEYYRLFCHLFWFEANNEYLESGRRQPASKAPVETIDLLHRNILSGPLTHSLHTALEHPAKLFTNGGYDQNIVWQEFDHTELNLQESELLLAFNAIEQGQLQRVIERYGDIHLLSRDDLPQVLISEEEAWLLPLRYSKTDVIWAVKLSENQRRSVDDYHLELLANGYWRLKKEIAVDDITSPIRYVDNIDEELQCKELLSITLEDFECRSFAEFESDNAQELTKDQSVFNRSRLAREIEYQVVIHPPYLPGQAERDALVLAWERIQKRWDNEVCDLNVQVARMEAEQSKIKDNLLGYMKQFFLGRDRERSQLKKEIDHLESICLSELSPSYRKENVALLNQLRSKLVESALSLANETDKAQQLEHWEQEKLKIDTRLEQCDQKRAKIQQDMEAFLYTRNEKKAAAEHVFLESWKELFDKYFTAINSNEIARDSKRDDIEIWISNNSRQLNKVLKKQSKTTSGDLVKEASKSSKKQQRKEQEQAKKRLEQIPRAYKVTISNLAEREQKLQQGLDQVSKEQERLGEELSTHQQSRNSIKGKAKESFLSKLLSKGKREADVAFSIDFPEEDLPDIGQLYMSKGKRYLAIAPDDDSELAKRTAMRLRASLVLKKGEAANG
ncbi:coiled-coil domain-containing protein [Endozoicomonas euniceicola]|uniref:Uncharacterized protein n=1 Tax=Endozoicomonas euniceicola TaxID=1234143 RepID=A0ABY6GT73_9GAMM|nr:hypothetical protein [Endozoicomonas euniceicola]UYM15900.1 hypothetical protein NX720_24285 [Endozoicomonas euniceicola]